MKFTALDKKLIKLVIERRTTIPVLHAAKYQDNRLAFTDMDIEATIPCPMGEGTHLLNIMAAMPVLTAGEW